MSLEDESDDSEFEYAFSSFSISPQKGDVPLSSGAGNAANKEAVVDEQPLVIPADYSRRSVVEFLKKIEPTGVMEGAGLVKTRQIMTYLAHAYGIYAQKEIQSSEANQRELRQAQLRAFSSLDDTKEMPISALCAELNEFLAMEEPVPNDATDTTLNLHRDFDELPDVADLMDRFATEDARSQSVVRDSLPAQVFDDIMAEMQSLPPMPDHSSPLPISEEPVFNPAMLVKRPYDEQFMRERAPLKLMNLQLSDSPNDDLDVEAYNLASLKVLHTPDFESRTLLRVNRIKTTSNFSTTRTPFPLQEENARVNAQNSGTTSNVNEVRLAQTGGTAASSSVDNFEFHSVQPLVSSSEVRPSFSGSKENQPLVGSANLCEWESTVEGELDSSARSFGRIGVPQLEKATTLLRERALTAIGEEAHDSRFTIPLSPSSNQRSLFIRNELQLGSNEEAEATLAFREQAVQSAIVANEVPQPLAHVLKETNDNLAQHSKHLMVPQRNWYDVLRKREASSDEEGIRYPVSRPLRRRRRRRRRPHPYNSAQPENVPAPRTADEQEAAANARLVKAIFRPPALPTESSITNQTITSSSDKIPSTITNSTGLFVASQTSAIVEPQLIARNNTPTNNQTTVATENQIEITETVESKQMNDNELWAASLAHAAATAAVGNEQAEFSAFMNDNNEIVADVLSNMEVVRKLLVEHNVQLIDQRRQQLGMTEPLGLIATATYDPALLLSKNRHRLRIRHEITKGLIMNERFQWGLLPVIKNRMDAAMAVNFILQLNAANIAGISPNGKHIALL